VIKRLCLLAGRVNRLLVKKVDIWLSLRVRATVVLANG
jgi:hypothetical protein